ncbi:Protein COFACTOR ASSEMBLY OF COMPLEX C SUBUNIT B CCB2, chloroplastic [Glycine soja]
MSTGNRLHPLYDDEDKTLLLDIDEDKWSFFKLVGILKDDIKCTSDFKLWWTRVNDVGLKELAFDSDALELTNFALSNNNEVKVYFKKNNDRGVVVTEGDVVALDDEDEGGSESGSENDNEGIVFKDSEEERAIEGNDGFDNEDEPLVNLISKKKCRKASHVGSRGGHLNVEEGNGELSEVYETKELYSARYEYDEEDKHKFVKYRKEELTRDFQFKIGLDVCSQREFKEAIVDHSIMNGRKVVFQPNDKVKARAKCKEKCGYEIFYNKVGRNSTYMIKTCRPKHHCGRLKSSNDVKLTQIMNVVRFKYGISISLVVAWKAKMIAKYCYLEAYGEERMHICVGNNYKLILERPPGLLLLEESNLGMTPKGLSQEHNPRTDSFQEGEEDRRLSKEHKDLKALHELKGSMTRSKAKFLQEEMAKRIKDGLLIKGKEGENHKEMNWTTEVEHLAKDSRGLKGILGLDESYLPRWIGYGFGSLLLLNHFLGSDSATVTPAQLSTEVLGLSLASFSIVLPYLGKFLKGAQPMDEKTIPDDTEQIFFMSTDIVDCLKEDLAWASYVLLRNTNVIAMEKYVQGDTGTYWMIHQKKFFLGSNNLRS